MMILKSFPLPIRLFDPPLKANINQTLSGIFPVSHPVKVRVTYKTQ